MKKSSLSLEEDWNAPQEVIEIKRIEVFQNRPRVKEKALSYSWSSCRTPSPAKRFPFQTRLFFRFYARHYLFVLSHTSAYINEMGFPFRIEPPTMSVIQSQNSSFFPIEFVHPIALQMKWNLSFHKQEPKEGGLMLV